MVILVWVPVLAIVILFAAGIRIVDQKERGLVARFGEYIRFAEPGFSWIIPIIDSITKVNITEKLVNVDKQEIITKDKLNAVVDAQVYFKVKPEEESVKNSQYNVYNVEYQIVNLARTTLRNIIGTMNLTDANSKRDAINTELMSTLAKETKSWGIDVVRTELKEINPPQEVQNVMNRVVIAENEKVAAIDFATAVETRADGERRAAIKNAEGIAQGKKIVAEANAYKIKTENEAARKYFVGPAQKLKQLEVTLGALEHNSKIVLTERGITPQIILGNIPTE